MDILFKGMRDEADTPFFRYTSLSCLISSFLSLTSLLASRNPPGSGIGSSPLAVHLVRRNLSVSDTQPVVRIAFNLHSMFFLYEQNGRCSISGRG